MPQTPDPDEEILTVSLDGVTWTAQFATASDELVSVYVFPDTEGRPGEPNLHWDLTTNNFDELPEGLPTKIRTAIYQRMRKRY